MPFKKESHISKPFKKLVSFHQEVFQRFYLILPESVLR